MKDRKFIIFFICGLILIASGLFLKGKQVVEAKQQEKTPIIIEENLKLHPKSSEQHKYYLGKANVNDVEMYYFTNDNGEINLISIESKINYINGSETPKVIVTNDSSYEIFIPEDSIFKNVDLIIND